MPPLPALIALRQAMLTFGGRPLFNGIDVGLSKGDKVCLVGRNGSGKSTLLKALAGIVQLDGGERFLQPGTTVAYLPQEPIFDGFATVADYVAAGLAEPAAYRVDALLDRVGLDGGRDPSTLSGGEARRAALARTLVGDPDVLLLDEPTNHLDLPTIEWLEGELKSYRGALLLISHDRAFLTALSRRTLWLDRGSLREMDQNFAAFEAWRAEVEAAEAREAERFEKKLEAELHWLARGVTARRTRNMGRLRALQQMRKQKAERLTATGTAELKIVEADRGGTLVIEAQNIAKSFETEAGTKRVVRDFSTRILRGDRVGLIGPNGAGKSTLLKMLTGQLAPDTGTVRLGTNLRMAYFDQRRAQLDPEATLRDTLVPGGGDSVVVNGQPRHVAAYMRDFLFDPGTMYTPVRALSGGERNRLLLARLFAEPANLIVMDEPTNDLDMETLDLLEEVLSDFEGTLLLVSHDRDFLDRLVSSVIAVEGDGVVREYAGGYSDYSAQRPKTAAAPDRPSAKAAAPVEREARAATKLGYKQQRELDELPGRIDALTAEIASLETQMADADLFVRDPARFQKVTQRLAAAQDELSAAEERWLELEELRESLARGA